MQNQEAFQDFFLFVPPVSETLEPGQSTETSSPSDQPSIPIRGENWVEIPVHDSLIVYARMLE